MPAEAVPNETAPAVVIDGQRIHPYIVIADRAYLSVQQFGALVRRRDRQLRSWRDAGFGPRHFTSGRTILYPLDEVQAWLAAGGKRPVGRPRKRAGRS